MRSRGKHPPPPEWSLTIARAVRDRRRAFGMTQQELADLAGCGTAFLYQLENGKPSVRLDKLMPVLMVLGLSVAIRPGQGPVSLEPVPR